MKKLLFIIICLWAFLPVPAQNTWVQKANYGGGARDEASGFSIGNTGYIFSGNDTGNYFMDMWAWTPHTNTWDSMAPFPGGYRIGLESASLNGCGYVFCGEHPNNCFIEPGGGVCAGVFYTDVWKYISALNTWELDTAFPGAARDFAAAVADPDDSTIYYGTGNDNGNAFLTDWWAFHAPTHTWKQLTDFPGGQRAFATGFYAGGKIYVGTGSDNDSVNGATSDMWQYTPATDKWQQVADIPGMPLRCASAFAIGNFGYVCMGLDNAKYTSGGWRYNTLTNVWQPIASYSGGPIADGVSFTIDSNGYVGTGIYGDSANSYFYEYTFDNSPALGIAALPQPGAITFYPNPGNGLFTMQLSVVSGQLSVVGGRWSVAVYSVSGQQVYSQFSTHNSPFSINLSDKPAGTYIYRVITPDGILQTGKLVIVK